MKSAKRARPLQPHDCVLVLGVRGAGKTYWTQQNIVDRARRVVVWDPHEEYRVQTSVTFQELASRPGLLDSDGSIGVRPEFDSIDELGDQFEDFVHLLRDTGGVVVVVDEVVTLETQQAKSALKFLATQSRHWGAGSPCVLISQRAVDIPKTPRAQASRIVAFRQTDPDDIDALAKRIGRTKAARILHLPRHVAVEWDEQDAFKKESEREENGHGGRRGNRRGARSNFGESSNDENVRAQGRRSLGVNATRKLKVV